MKTEYRVGRYDSIDEFEIALKTLADDGWTLEQLMQGPIKIVAVYMRTVKI